jgi:GntR family transcriptional regulator
VSRISLSGSSLELSEASGVPFYRQIVDQLAELIRARRLAPETRLPSVRDLAGELMVSLITTRRAYADLEAAGLIVRRQGQGTFVADHPEGASREQAVGAAREILTESVNRARRLGLSANDIRAIIDSALDQGEDSDDHPASD